jgi:hypothetical protein
MLRNSEKFKDNLLKNTANDFGYDSILLKEDTQQLPSKDQPIK